MLIMPIWAWIIFFTVGGTVYLVTLPKRKRDAADRKRLFEERQQKGGRSHAAEDSERRVR